jgi:hypothetical protein
MSTIEKLTVATMLLIDGASAYQTSQPQQRGEPLTVTRAEPSAAERTIATQLERPVCSLAQPERWQKAKDLLARNHLLASCAVDTEHPMPSGIEGQVAVIRP